MKAFRDGYLPTQAAEVKDAFEETKRAVRPDLILTHHRHDRHQDHRMIAELTWNTFRNHLIAEYEIPKYEGDLGHPNLFVPLAAELVAAEDRAAPALLRVAGRRAAGFARRHFEAVLRIRGIECNAPEGLAEAFHVSKLVI